MHLDTLQVARRADGHTGARLLALSLILVTELPNHPTSGYGGYLVKQTVATPDGQDAVVRDVALATVAPGGLADWRGYWIQLRQWERWDRREGEEAPNEGTFTVDGPRDIFSDVEPGPP